MDSVIDLLGSALWTQRLERLVKRCAPCGILFGLPPRSTQPMTANAFASAEFSVKGSRTFSHQSPARWILSHLRFHWWLVIVMFTGAFANALLAAAVPVLVGQAFNTILGNSSNLRLLLNITLILGASQFLRGGLQFARNFGAEVIAQRMERDIRDELYVSLLGKSMTFHNLLPVGDTMARATNDVHEVNLLFSPGINLVIGSGNFLIMPFIVAPTIHPALLLTPIVYTIAYFFALWQYLHELRPISDQVRTTFGNMNARLAEALDGIEIVKGHAQEPKEMARFSANARAFRDAFVHQGDIEARFVPLLLLGLATGAAFLHAMILYSQGAINVGQVIAYVGLIELFGFPTFVSQRAYSQVSLGLASARRILDLIVQRSELDRNQEGYAGKMRGEIEFKDVTFTYESGEPAIHDVSFRVEPGQTVAIVGQTGSGKTTLAKLINRTYDVASGHVLVDGVDVREWDLEALRRQISIIEQDVFLFTRSVAGNIAFGMPGAGDDDIHQAAHDAQADSFIRSFHDGYQTKVGERGVTLSGGQRQRIALARAFLTDPQILILDDATSSIDSATEDEIQRAIFRAAEGRTTLLITHRLSQIRWADLILVMRKGRLAAAGSHEDLMKTSEAYHRIFTRDEGD
jgi:ATP-binding cassette subfamily B protein